MFQADDIGIGFGQPLKVDETANGAAADDPFASYGKLIII